MTEPPFQPAPEPLRREPETEPPAWRNLAVGAGLLVVAALALPLVLHDGGQAPPVHPAAAIAPAPAPAPPPARVVEIPIPVPARPAPAPARTALPAPARPRAQPAANIGACALNVPELARNEGAGTVVSFEDRAVALARVEVSQKVNGGLIDPDYLDNLRVVVRMDSGGARIHLAPRTMPVRIGDRVTLQDLHRSPALPCNYVPPLITADLGPAPLPGGPAAPAGSPP